MKPNKFVIEKQVAAFRMDNGLGASEPVTLKSLLLKLNVLTVFRPLSDSFSGMCLKDNSGHRFMLVNSNQPMGRLFEDNIQADNEILAAAFRISDLEDDDLKEIANFKDIVKSYLKMERIAQNEAE